MSEEYVVDIIEEEEVQEDIQFFIFTADLKLKRKGIGCPGCSSNIVLDGEYALEKPVGFTYDSKTQRFSVEVLDIVDRDIISYSVEEGDTYVKITVTEPVTAYSTLFPSVTLTDLELVLTADEPNKYVMIRLSGENYISVDIEVTLP